MATRTTAIRNSVDAHIVSTPGVAGGRPRIAGHRMRVQDIAVWHERMGMSPDEIADQFDLTLGQVYAALAFYFDHRKEIQKDIARDRKFIAAAKRRSSSLVQAKLKQTRG
jgi:uncharacterized protein (DUF433 family)